MPAPTVTVDALASSLITSSKAFRDSRLCVLSAILLKQCRLPSTFKLLSRLTYSCACCTEFAEYKRSVLYSRLPAQFFKRSAPAQLSIGNTTWLEATAASNLTKVLLSMIAALCLSSVLIGQKMQLRPCLR